MNRSHSTTRVQPLDWKTESFRPNQTNTVAWNVPLSPTDINSLIAGFRPESMDDKWFIYSEGPNDRGKLLVNLHRSWTGIKVAQVVVDVTSGSEHIDSITWNNGEQTSRLSSHEAKETVAGTFKWVLGVKFPEAALQ